MNSFISSIENLTIAQLREMIGDSGSIKLKQMEENNGNTSNN